MSSLMIFAMPVINSVSTNTQGLSLLGLVDVRHAICYVLIDEGCLSLQSVTLDCVSTERFIGVRL